VAIQQQPTGIFRTRLFKVIIIKKNKLDYVLDRISKTFDGTLKSWIMTKAAFYFIQL